MHIPDGFISGEINITTAVISAAAVGLALRNAGRKLDDKQVPLLGVTAAFIFAAQMINFPIAYGTSGHFMGAALAAIMLGPLASLLIMSIVLIVQCLGFADGGLTALGTNIFNMGVVAGIGGYYIFSAVRMALPKTDSMYFISLTIASWLSIVLASGFCALELAISGTSPFHIVLPAMVGVHAVIGIGEAIITVAVVSMVYKYRSDLIQTAFQKS